MTLSKRAAFPIRSAGLLSALLLVPATLLAQGWTQWGRTPNHDSQAPTAGHRLTRIAAELPIDMNAQILKQMAGGNLLVHYQVPLIDGEDVFVPLKRGPVFTRTEWQTQSWSIRNLRWENGTLVTRWSSETDWKPVPAGSPGWEPVYHCALTADSVWTPAGAGSVMELRRSDGSVIRRVNPFGPTNDSSIYTTGPLTIDRAGNLFYHAIQLDRSAPWTADVVNAWLVRVGADGTVSRATFGSLTPNAPAATSLCTSAFVSGLPFPPDPAAVAPKVPCGSQRPGVNVAPAVAADGTIYTVSRAHFNDRWSYLIAVNPDLTPKWAASMRNRFNDGCDVTLPPSGTPGGCRAGATRGVDPTDNEPGSGRVRDDSTSSPVVAPDGRILYGAYTRYNYSAGHLMMFAPNGDYVGAYGFGWDITPAIYPHGGTYSIILKENRYNVSSYCNDPSVCPPDRNSATPSNPEQYLITQLDANLNVEWQYRSTNTLSCSREPSGAITCQEDHPHGFEWCVNAVAVDSRGVVYANSEDGRLYAIGQGGVALESIFLRLALGAAYTPLSVDDRGRIYTQNDGQLFVVTDASPRRRAAAR